MYVVYQNCTKNNFRENKIENFLPPTFKCFTPNPV